MKCLLDEFCKEKCLKVGMSGCFNNFSSLFVLFLVLVILTFLLKIKELIKKTYLLLKIRTKILSSIIPLIFLMESN